MEDKMTESGGAYHEIDEETGQPYWRLWGADWMDSEDMKANEAMELSPRSFPPGTRIVIIEPMVTEDDKANEFYTAIAEQKEYYPPEEGGSDDGSS